MGVLHLPHLGFDESLSLNTLFTAPHDWHRNNTDSMAPPVRNCLIGTMLFFKKVLRRECIVFIAKSDVLDYSI